MAATLIETHYLPSIAFFSALSPATEVILEKHEHYVKQSYRNRCYIKAVHGVVPLTIPVLSGSGKTLVSDVKIDYGQKWLNNHWRTIQSAYGKAPFFAYYADDLEKILYGRHIFLYDLNVSLLSMCLKWLKWDIDIKESLSYTNMTEPDVSDLRSTINPKNSNYLQNFYMPVAYPQVFGNTFAENLSLIDLIFCTGPEAGRIVQASSVK